MAVKDCVDIFQKCFEFRDADDIKDAGLYPYFRTISSAQDPVVVMNGREVVMLGSNNYLGLTNHPEVKQAARGRHRALRHRLRRLALPQRYARHPCRARGEARRAS